MLLTGTRDPHARSHDLLEVTYDTAAGDIELQVQQWRPDENDLPVIREDVLEDGGVVELLEIVGLAHVLGPRRRPSRRRVSSKHKRGNAIDTHDRL